jgi:hypothetical protein
MILFSFEVNWHPCAVYNPVARAWKLGVEVMDLRRINLFNPYLSPVLPYLGPETFLFEDTGFDV